MSKVEQIFKYKLKDEISNKYYNNLIKIFEILSKELINISKNINEISSFLNNNKFSKEKFENDRRLIGFFNASTQFCILCKRLVNLINIETFQDKLKEKNSSLISTIENIKEDSNNIEQKIIDIKNIFKNSFDENIFNKLKIKDFNFELNKLQNIKHSKLCMMCLHNLEDEPNTNLFSYDFHLSCINFWLNLVDNQSPFI